MRSLKNVPAMTLSESIVETAAVQYSARLVHITQTVCFSADNKVEQIIQAAFSLAIF